MRDSKKDTTLNNLLLVVGLMVSVPLAVQADASITSATCIAATRHSPLTDETVSGGVYLNTLYLF